MRCSHELMINASSRPFAEAELNQPTYNNDKRWQADHVSFSFLFSPSPAPVVSQVFEHREVGTDDATNVHIIYTK